MKCVYTSHEDQISNWNRRIWVYSHSIFVILLDVCMCGHRFRRQNKPLILTFNPLKPEFAIVIFTHYKSRIVVASQFLTCSGWRWLEVGDKWKNILLILKQFHENFRSKTTRFQEIKSFFRDAKWCFNLLTAKSFNWNFHPLEVVSRWRDPQLQVSENYSDFTKWRLAIFKFLLIYATLYLQLV